MASVDDRWFIDHPDGTKTKSSRHGKGSRWRARWIDPDTGKEKARHFARKIDATEHLVTVQASIRSGDYVDPKAGQITLTSFYAEWSERQVWAAGTSTAMSLAVRTCTFADVELGKLRRSHIEVWVKTMSTTLAPGTIRTRVNNVRSVLRGAVRDRVITRDPSDGVVLPRLRRAEHAMQIPTPDAVGAILRAAQPEFRAYVALCAFAGLRLGEASAVQVGDIDFLRRRLRVARQVQRAGRGHVAITPPKHGSERQVFLADGLLELLSAHIARGRRGDEGWLFWSGTGDPPHQNTIGHRWRTTVAAAGLEPIRLHDLRHFYASGLIAAGCDVVTVQRALGHAKATTTLSTYSHLWPSAEDRTRTAASALMESAMSAEADSTRTHTPAATRPPA